MQLNRRARRSSQLMGWGHRTAAEWSSLLGWNRGLEQRDAVVPWGYTRSNWRRQTAVSSQCGLWESESESELESQSVLSKLVRRRISAVYKLNICICYIYLKIYIVYGICTTAKIRVYLACSIERTINSR